MSFFIEGGETARNNVRSPFLFIAAIPRTFTARSDIVNAFVNCISDNIESCFDYKSDSTVWNSRVVSRACPVCYSFSLIFVLKLGRGSQLGKSCLFWNELRRSCRFNSASGHFFNLRAAIFFICKKCKKYLSPPSSYSLPVNSFGISKSSCMGSSQDRIIGAVWILPKSHQLQFGPERP